MDMHFADMHQWALIPHAKTVNKYCLQDLVYYTPAIIIKGMDQYTYCPSLLYITGKILWYFSK